MADGKRVAFVSGAARGIGLAIAEAFWPTATASRSATRTSRRRPPRPAGSIRAVSGCWRSISTSPSGLGRLGDRRHHGRVREARRPDQRRGNDRPRGLGEHLRRAWAGLLAVHLDGTLRCCRAAYPALSASPAPAIVSISSVAATVGIPKRASYSAAKGAIESLTRVLAVEWAEAGIRVNAVAPGYTMTKRMEGTIASGLLDESQVTRLIPIGRFARPEEIADAVPTSLPRVRATSPARRSTSTEERPSTATGKRLRPEWPTIPRVPLTRYVPGSSFAADCAWRRGRSGVVRREQASVTPKTAQDPTEGTT